VPTIEILCKAHDRDRFDCGQKDLNAYLKRTALQHIKKNVSKTFAFVEQDEILGYYTLNSYQIMPDRLPHTYIKGFPRSSNIPGLLLGRLAVSLSHQRSGIGTLLLLDALERTLIVAQNVGVFGLFVDAKDETARTFYEQFAFLSLAENRLKMFLPIQTIASLFETP
jgi:GNAT superfamily N-acetyltransferase